MSLLKADTIKPVTSGGDLSLQGDSGGSAVDCLNITSAGDINFSGNTDAKIKLPSAGGLYESDGSTAVLTESGGVVTLDNVAFGSSVPGVGKVLQVLQTTKLDTTTTTAGTFEDMTGMSVAITPSATGSKVFVLCDVNLNNAVAGYFTHYKLVRGTTDIYVGAAAGDRVRATGLHRDSESGSITSQSGKFLDSPSTTSATTYKLQWRIETGGGSTGYLNRTGPDTDNTIYGRTASSITVMEISA